MLHDLDRGVWQSVSLGIDDSALQHDLLRKAGREKQDENDDLDPIHITFSAFVLPEEIVELPIQDVLLSTITVFDEGLDCHSFSIQPIHATKPKR